MGVLKTSYFGNKNAREPPPKPRCSRTCVQTLGFGIYVCKTTKRGPPQSVTGLAIRRLLMHIGYFFKITEKFNKAFKMKLQHTLNAFDEQPSFVSNGRLMSSDFCGESGYNTPHSNAVVVGLVQREKDLVEIQLQVGPLIVTTATVDFRDEEGALCSLTLQTNPLPMFDMYPLHVYSHEAGDFFQKNGYGRLSLYFALLYAVTSGMTMCVLCENPVTAYILSVLFRSKNLLEADVATNHRQYLHKLSELEERHGASKNFEDFSRHYAVLVPEHGSLIYRIHATETNCVVVTHEIEKWIHDRIKGVSFADFMSIYVKGPKLVDYKQLSRLQEDFPQFTASSFSRA